MSVLAVQAHAWFPDHMAETSLEQQGMPGKEDVVRVVRVEPGMEHGEGLEPLAKRVADWEFEHGRYRAGHACLCAVAVVHVKVQQRHTLDACTRRINIQPLVHMISSLSLLAPHPGVMGC